MTTSGPYTRFPPTPTPPRPLRELCALEPAPSGRARHVCLLRICTAEDAPALRVLPPGLATAAARWYLPGMAAERPLAWYVTPHGNGHAVRTCDVVRAFNTLFPEVPVALVARHPEVFLRHRVPSPSTTIRHDGFDTGLVQHDSVRSDTGASLRAARDLVARRGELVAREVAWLREARAGGVVCDIPAIPLEAARDAGIPALATGNFSWNWIYEHMAPADPAWEPVAEAFREGYACCDLLLRMPFHEPMRAFPRIEDIPVVATPGRARRDEMAARTGCDPAARWVLLSFSTLHWDADALRRLSAMEDHAFFTVRPLEWKAPRFHAVDRHEFPFCDVLASCDAVLTKPGFGIVSECVVNRKPVVFAERPEWPESAPLVEGIRRFGRGAPLSLEQLYAGDVRGALDAAVSAPPPAETAPAGGAEVAARRIRSFLP